MTTPPDHDDVGAAVDVRRGHSASSIVLHVPHAGIRIPADVRAGIVLGDDALRREVLLMADGRTDALATSAAYGIGPQPTVIVNPWSRLVVDPERFLDEREELDDVGMGAVYTRTHDGEILRADDAAMREVLLDRYFHPYTAAVGDAVADRLELTGRCTILDLHSYPRDPLPYERRPTAPRPPICLGVDPDHTPASLVDAAMDVFTDHALDVGINTPFSGAYVPASHHGLDTRVTSLMVEVRRDVYLSDGLQALDPVRARHVTAALRDLMTLLQVQPWRADYASTHLDLFGIDLHELADGVVITAADPFSLPQSADDNRERNQSLREAVAEHGGSALDVDAHAPGPDGHAEPSLFVTGLDLETACTLGRRFEQNAIFELRGGLLRVIVCATGRVLSEDRFVAEQHDGFVRVRTAEPDEESR